MIRVAFLSYEYPPVGGGAGSVVYDIFNNTSYGNYFLYTNDHAQGAQERIYKIKEKWFLKILGGAGRYLSFFFSVGKEFSNYDVIVLNDFFSHIYAALFFDDLMLSKCVFYMHGQELQSLEAHRSIFFRTLNIAKRVKHAYKTSMKLIFVSDFLKSDFHNRIGINISNIIMSKSVVINNGIADSFRPSFNEYNNSEKVEIVSASRLIEGKGYVEMLEHLAPILLTKKNYLWRIIGDGPLLEDLQSEVNRLGLTDKVFFLGRRNREELPEIYNKSSVFLLLSKFEEAHPLVYMEAAVCGLPSIAFNRGGCAESVMDGVTGFLINDYYELESSINDCMCLDKKEIVKSSDLYSIKNTIRKLRQELSG